MGQRGTKPNQIVLTDRDLVRKRLQTSKESRVSNGDRLIGNIKISG